MKFAYGVLSLVLLSLVSAFAAQPDRISTAIDSSDTVVLTGSVHPKAEVRFDRGAVNPSMKLPYVTMLMRPSPSQQAELDRLLVQQQDRKSPNYHKWLTPEQYADRFGLSPHDVEQVKAWLQSRGFSIVQVARGRDWIAFSGTAGLVQNTFHAALHHFLVEGEMHFANATDISIPKALSGAVVGFRGLDDFRLSPMTTRISYPPGVFFPAIVGPYYTNGGFHYLAPDDIATIYNIAPLYDAGIDGTGMKLVVVGQVDVDLDDIRDFRAGFNLPPKDPQVIMAGGDPGNSQGDLVESDLDLEWTGAVARNAQIIFVTSPAALGGVFNAATYAIDQDLAPVISMSYGGCESLNKNFIPSNEPTMQKANTEGITFIASTGDSGAAGCDAPSKSQASGGLAVNYPASSPEVTGLGGTEFTGSDQGYWNGSNGANGGSAISYIPEDAWNDSAQRNQIVAGGGGKSSCVNSSCNAGFPKPAWQTGPGVPNDKVRDVPDVSMSASADHDGYMICDSGGCSGGITGADIVGGTSASAPVFAGIVTLLNQYLGNTPPAGLGNINQQLYPLAVDTTNGVFHDTTTGSNKVPCAQGSKDCPPNGPFVIGYDAGVGYDLATGLGSVDANNLACHWTNGVCALVALTVVPNEIAVGSTGPVALTATVTAGSGSDTPTGTVNFLKDNDANNPIGTGTLTAGTLTVNYDPSALPAHRYAITAAYGGDSEFGAAKSAAVTLTVGTPTSATLSVAPGTVLIGATQPVTLTATVSANSGTPTGTVTFKEGTTQLGTGALSSNTAVLNYDASSLPAGTHRITASYPGDTNFADSDSETEVLGVQDFTAAAAPATVSISQAGQTGTTTINLTPVGSFDQAISFTCTKGLPAESSCSFFPASVTPGTSPAKTVLTISTKAPSARLAYPFSHGGKAFYALLFPAGFGMVVLASGSRRKKSRWLLPIVVLMVSMLSFSACGGGGGGGSSQKDPGTPAGTSKVTITAATTGGAVSHTVQITVTVLQ